MVLDRVHRVACATDMVQSQSWEPVPVEAAVKTGKCGWYIVQVLLSGLGHMTVDTCGKRYLPTLLAWK